MYIHAYNTCMYIHAYNTYTYIHVYTYVLTSAMNSGLLPLSKGRLMCALPRPPADDLVLSSVCLSLAAKVQSQRSV